MKTPLFFAFGQQVYGGFYIVHPGREKPWREVCRLCREAMLEPDNRLVSITIKPKD